MVTSVQNTSTATATQAAAVSAATSQAGATQDRFLKLLVTQMRNQDPLNPLDNAQVTSQMAQLSTVTGIDKLNATVQALSANMAAAQSLQAASMIGHVALVPGNNLDLLNGASNAGLELSQPADRVTVKVENANGTVVRTLQLGAQDAGVVQFAWDGKDDTGAALADGRYRFSAESQLGSAKSTPLNLAYGLVDSVSLTASGALLGMGSLGDVGLEAVRKIL